MWISRKIATLFWLYLGVSWFVTFLREVLQHKYPDHFTIIVATWITLMAVIGWGLEAINGSKK